MENLKQIIAQNLIELRKRKKYTQQDMADMLQYSDKAISKWEKGDSLPDIEILYQICSIYGVTLDYLTHEGHYEDKKEYLVEDSQIKNKIIISMLFISAVWMLSIFVYAFFMIMLKQNIWPILVWGVPATGYTLLFFNRMWGTKKYVFTINTYLIWSTITAAYFQFVYLTGSFNFWIIFILGAPLQFAAVLWSQLRR